MSYPHRLSWYRLRSHTRLIRTAEEELKVSTLEILDRIPVYKEKVREADEPRYKIRRIS